VGLALQVLALALALALALVVAPALGTAALAGAEAREEDWACLLLRELQLYAAPPSHATTSLEWLPSRPAAP